MNELPKKHRIWKKERNKGPLRYVLIYWVLPGGVIVCLLKTLYDYFTGEAITFDSILEYAFLGILWSIIGGAITWARSENRYQTYLKQTVNED